jgi:hypothetical protein
VFTFRAFHDACLIVDRAELRISTTGLGSDSRGIDGDKEQHRRAGKCAGKMFSHGIVLLGANSTMAKMNAA